MDHQVMEKTKQELCEKLKLHSQNLSDLRLLNRKYLHRKNRPTPLEQLNLKRKVNCVKNKLVLSRQRIEQLLKKILEEGGRS